MLPGLIALVSFFTYPVAGLNAQPEKSLFDHLSENGQVIELVLKTDMDSLINKRRRDDYQPAELYFTDEDGVTTMWEVGVVPRGNYRRRICAFPPIRLNFSKGQLEERGLKPEYDKMKVVAPCLEEEKSGEDYVLKEYLVYKLYNQLTPNSYRVQLAQITYQDTESNYDKINHYAILIEETDELAARLGGVEFEGMNQPKEAFAAEAENLMSVFQYMIGNEDWDLVMLRNLKLVRPGDGGKLIPVPYDFDFSGFVNAPYAVPNSKYGLTNIRQRAFMGIPVEKDLLKKTLKHFRLYRNHLRAVIRSFKLLGFSERMNAVDYLESFYRNEFELIRENERLLKESEDKKGNSAQNPDGQ
ncbi:MAG: hypothetical protein J5I94_10365 [Phaeodactylibacter sp.]|nr:hypothetical protein [Phaeodactylibacter sp.]